MLDSVFFLENHRKWVYGHDFFFPVKVEIEEKKMVEISSGNTLEISTIQLIEVSRHFHFFKGKNVTICKYTAEISKVLPLEISTIFFSSISTFTGKKKSYRNTHYGLISSIWSPASKKQQYLSPNRGRSVCKLSDNNLRSWHCYRAIQK